MRKSRNKTGSRTIRSGLVVAATAAVVVAGTAMPAFAASFSITPTQVSASGGSVIYFIGGSALDTNRGVRFLTPTTATCPTNYNTAASAGSTAVNGGLDTASSATRAWITTPALDAGSSYKVCLYANATTGAAFATDTTTDTVTSVNGGTLSSYTGAANAKITLTSSTASFSTSVTYATQFVAAPTVATICPATYQTVDTTHIVAASTRGSATALSVTVPTLTAGTPYLVCAYNGTASTSTLVARSNTTFASYSTSLPATTVSPSSGPSGAATNILVSVPTTSTIFTGAPDTLLARNSCPGVRPATAALGATTGFEPFAATTTTKINASKLAVVLPAGVIAGAADVTTPWNVCVYASTSTGAALLAAPGTYSAAQVLDLSTAAYAVGSGASGASASGPVQGGSTITISGLLGIPTDPTALLTASLGGSPIDITTVNDATSFTGTTTKHAPGAVALSITTAAGTQTTSTTPYTYNYGIAVTPNTAVAGSTPVLDITGAGFTAIPTATWGTAYAASGATGNGIGAGAGKARVLLTDNAWNNQSAFGSTGVTATNGVAPLAQCTGVLVISDNELICTMDLAHKLVVTNTGADVNAPSGNVPVGVYNVTLINSDAAAALTTAANNYSVVSSTSAFTVAPF